MSYVQAVLLAEARKRGHGVRCVQYRHRHITERPLGLVLWQLGAEPFTAAAAAWGFGAGEQNVVVPGEPRDRELLFRALTEFARAFNPWFEDGEPQIVVPNGGTLTMLARLGRRLAYLPTDGEHPADPALVRLGRHLKFLGEYSRHPGQQLVLVLTDLLRAHWVCELSELEAQNLAALDAAIAPPKGIAVHAAVEAAEGLSVGPLPQAEDDQALDPLLLEFNKQRKRSTVEKLVRPLRRPIQQHYEGLIFPRVWPLLWRCLERERSLPEAPSVERRWKSDQEALQRHRDWMEKTGGITRVRQTGVQAAYTLRRWEEATRVLEAEEALDDPVRMVPYILANEALVGEVVAVDLEHKEKPAVQWVKRPRITVAVSGRCLMPMNKALHWSKTAASATYVIVDKTAQGKGDHVVLQHQTSANMERPKRGDRVVFSVHGTAGDPPLKLPGRAPWTHVRAESSPASLEHGDDARSWE